MMKVNGYQGQTIGVMGLGKSGLSAARALLSGGARVVAWDDRETARDLAKDLGADVMDLGSPETWESTSPSRLILSPGIPHTHPEPHPSAQEARARQVPIIGDVDLLAANRGESKMIGVTGTNGKSTTTALLGHILQQARFEVAVGGNLGTPALDLERLNDNGCYLMEMSSYQLELTPTAVFSVAILLNISPDHLDRHGGMEGYVQAKERIFHAQGPNDISVCGVDDDISLGIYDRLTRTHARPCVPISGHRFVPKGVYVESGWLVDDREGRREPIIQMEKLPALAGTHNAQNAAAAAAAALSLDVPRKVLLAALRSFPGLAHRQERLGRIGPVTFINDSKATNAEAAAKALATYQDIHWIIGGVSKDGGLADALPFVDTVKAAYCIGQSAEDFANQLAGKTDVTLCGDLVTATKAAFKAASEAGGGIVLLSPAAASFDQYPNFEVRGAAFHKAFNDLKSEAGV
ncbi:MAG: UDP-N-acetylmuramoyl-L-alanine--D-glutamate ligase [Magnetovibrionaceae bacterium]